MSAHTGFSWERDELEALRAAYNRGGMPAAREACPARSRSAVRSRIEYEVKVGRLVSHRGAQSADEVDPATLPRFDSTTFMQRLLERAAQRRQVTI